MGKHVVELVILYMYTQLPPVAQIMLLLAVLILCVWCIWVVIDRYYPNPTKRKQIS